MRDNLRLPLLLRLLPHGPSHVRRDWQEAANGTTFLPMKRWVKDDGQARIKSYRNIKSAFIRCRHRRWSLECLPSVCHIGAGPPAEKHHSLPRIIVSHTMG